MEQVLKKFILNDPNLKYIIVSDELELLLITESAKAYFGVSDEITSLKSLGIDFNIEESGVSNYHQGLNQNNQVLLFKYTVQAENNQFAIHIEDSTVFKH